MQTSEGTEIEILLFRFSFKGYILFLEIYETPDIFLFDILKIEILVKKLTYDY